MKVSEKPTRFGVNIVPSNPRSYDPGFYDSACYLLGFIEGWLRREGVMVEFTDVEPDDGDGINSGIRFNVSLL